MRAAKGNPHAAEHGYPTSHLIAHRTLRSNTGESV
jgi:hypothetical protein